MPDASGVTSGTRAVRGWLQVGGTYLPVVSCDASLAASDKSASFSATLALSGLPAGLDEHYFATTTPIQAAVAVGVSSGTKTVLAAGQLDSVEIDYTDRLLVVQGRCNSAPMHERKSMEKFANQTPDQIVKTVAARNGLTPDVDASSIKAGRYVQIDWAKLGNRVSDAGLLHKLAEYLDARWWVSGTTLHFKKGGAQGSAYVVNYTPSQNGGPARGDFMRLRVVRKLALSKTVKAKVTSWNSRKKQAVTSEKSMPGSGGTTSYNYRIPGLTRDQADQHALSKVASHARHEISVSLEMVGDPTLDVAMKLRLRGTAFDQDFTIESVHHSVGQEGYAMSISAHSEKQGRTAS